jgi:CheY-like chemotaxis protein
MTNRYAEKSVIIADNSSVMTRIIENHLVKMGFVKDNIVTAKDGHQAHLIIGLKDFDLAITSYHMELVNGLELLKKIRNDSNEKVKNLLYFVISAERKEQLVEELMAAGCNSYLSKPFTYNQLEKKINQIFPKEATPPSAPQSSGTNTINPKITSAFIESAIESLGQYMVSAVVEDPIESIVGDLYFGSLIELNDKAHGVRINIALYFPKDVACSIYEGIFGEVDLEQVCGVVQELGNIIAGIVKPKISHLTQEVVSLVNPDAVDDAELSFDLGLPQAKMGDNEWKFELNNDSSTEKIIIPFEINGGSVLMKLHFEKID